MAGCRLREAFAIERCAHAGTPAHKHACACTRARMHTDMHMCAHARAHTGTHAGFHSLEQKWLCQDRRRRDPCPGAPKTSRWTSKALPRGRLTAQGLTAQLCPAWLRYPGT